MKQVTIGCYSAFWGDSPWAAKQLLEMDQHLDYIVADYLAELTMGLLARSSRSATARKHNTGFIAEFLDLVVAPHIDLIVQKKTKIVTNSGGLDPVGLKNAISSFLAERGLTGEITVAAVSGDDICPRRESLLQQGAFAGFDPISGAGEAEDEIDTSRPLLSLNAYIGAEPITEALRQGADIVVTGRCVDSALVVGPLAYELGWTYDASDAAMLDRLAAASLAGHIVECGGQATGGNYTDWRASAFSAHGGWANMGYPILTFDEDATFTISKPQGTGGIVDTNGVCEQMLYEVLDPENYVLPDVVLDMSRVALAQVSDDVVRVQGAKGKPPTPWLKCTAVEQRGFRLTVDVLVCGEEAETKATVLGRAMVQRANRLAAERFPEAQPIAAADSAVQLIGAEDSLGNARAPGQAERREVALRVPVRCDDRRVLDILAKECAPFLTNSCPGICMLTAGRPKSSPSFAASSVLVRRDAVVPEVHVGERAAVRVPFATKHCIPVTPARCCLQARGATAVSEKHWTGTPGWAKLHRIAIARSGDKGDSANVAVIARDPAYYPWLLDQLTPDVVFAAFRHFIAPGGCVSRFEVPGVHAVNFVVTRSLGGGGLSSLRLDRQAKSYGQLALSKIHIRVPLDAVPARL